MKKVMILAAALSTLAAGAYAGDFDNTSFGVNVTSGKLDVAVDANKEGLTGLEVGFTDFEHYLWGLDADIRFALGTDLVGEDNIYTRAEYNVESNFSVLAGVYGSLALEYQTNTDFGNGVAYFDPSVGVELFPGYSTTSFAEVGYTWDISNDWNSEGGYGQLGLAVDVGRGVTLEPSLIRTFDTDADETNANFDVSFSF